MASINKFIKAGPAVLCAVCCAAMIAPQQICAGTAEENAAGQTMEEKLITTCAEREKGSAPKEQERKPIFITQGERIPPLDGRLGSAGRLYIPDVGISVALETVSYRGNKYNQALTDRQDTAVFYPRGILSLWGGICNDPTVADHWNQGFEALKSVVPGQTKAYVYDAYGGLSAVYLAADKFEGHNTEDMLTDKEYKPIWDAGYDLLTYTCNDSWRNITVVEWDCVGGGDQAVLPAE